MGLGFFGVLGFSSLSGWYFMVLVFRVWACRVWDLGFRASGLQGLRLRVLGFTV
jgi:hypothetical protein